MKDKGDKAYNIFTGVMLLFVMVVLIYGSLKMQGVVE